MRKGPLTRLTFITYNVDIPPSAAGRRTWSNLGFLRGMRLSWLSYLKSQTVALIVFLSPKRIEVCSLLKIPFILPSISVWKTLILARWLESILVQRHKTGGAEGCEIWRVSADRPFIKMSKVSSVSSSKIMESCPKVCQWWPFFHVSSIKLLGSASEGTVKSVPMSWCQNGIRWYEYIRVAQSLVASLYKVPKSLYSTFEDSGSNSFLTTNRAIKTNA